MKAKHLIYSFVFLLSTNTSAQQANPIIPETPPSPQAEAFTRLGNFEVNNNYGAPDISLPLFEIDFHGFKIPLALHYEATPIKPGYNYDVTGLGWTLSGNSCISRTIKDRADEYGLFNNPFQLDPGPGNDINHVLYKYYADKLDQLNFQYDSYNIVLPSGRTIPFFMYKSDGIMTYKKMPKDCNVIINCHCQSNMIEGFTVTDEQGVIYSFTISDTATNGYENDFNANRPVTWLLTRIDVPAKGPIIYEYNEPVEFHTYNPIDEPTITIKRLAAYNHTEDMNVHSGLQVIKSWQTPSPKYKMRLLSRISYGPTNVNFVYENSSDYSSTNRPHLERISVADSGNTIKTFKFGFDDSCLTSLVITGQNNVDKLKYNLEYHSRDPGANTDYWGNLCRSNCEVGNFNIYIDNNGLSTFIVDQILDKNHFCCRIPNSSSGYFKLKLKPSPEGDSRTPSLPENHGILKRITYPNGGSTFFEFENHRFLTANSADGDFVFDRKQQRVIEGGGFRIKSITNFAADGITVVSEDHYEYGFANVDVPNCGIPLPTPEYYGFNVHTGYGEAVVDPNILTFMRYSYSLTIPYSWNPGEFRKMILGLDSEYKKDIYDIQGRDVWWDAAFSATTFRSLLGGRRPVVYPEITVYHGGHPYSSGPSVCKSKTVYKYDGIYRSNLEPSRYYLATFGKISVPATGYFEPLGYFQYGIGNVSESYPAERPNLVCWEEPSKRHQLTSKSEYSCVATNGEYQWNIVSEEKYGYSNEDLSVDGKVFNSVVSLGRDGLRNVQYSFQKPLDEIKLVDFYINQSQKLGRSTLTDKTTTVYRQGGTRVTPNTTVEIYSYLYPGVMKQNTYSDFYDETFIFDYKKGVNKTYVGQLNSSNSVIQEMKSRNMLACLVSSESYLYPDAEQPMITDGIKIDYARFGDDILPSVLYKWNGDFYDTNKYEADVKVRQYDDYGNPIYVQDLKTMVCSVILWGDHGRYMTAMISNVPNEETCNMIQQQIARLNAMTSRQRYDAILSMLPATATTQVETWDYQPLIGVTSHTDASGKTMLYEYDGLGRLKTEKRVVNGTNGTSEIIKEYDYNFKNQ